MTSIRNNLHIIYLLLALPIVVCFAFLTKPFDAPDEPVHYLRTLQMSEGHFTHYQTENGLAGDKLPVAAINFIRLSKHDNVTENVQLDHDPTFISFPSTITYHFINYLPNMTGALIGKIFNQDQQTIFYLSRLFNALTAIILATFAIKYISRGKFFAFSLLIMPMTLFEFAAVSQDAMLIGMCALGIGLTNLLLDNKNNHHFLLIMIAFAFLCVGLGKPVYLPLLFIPTIMFRYNHTLFIKSLFLAVISCLFILYWSYRAKFIYTSPVSGVNFAAQTTFLLQHPSFIFSLIFNSVIEHSFYLYSFIGQLGWLNVFLPQIIYPLFLLGMMICFMTDYFSADTNKNRINLLLISLMCFCVFIAINVILYITYTPLYYPTIHGLQGRYLIPIALTMTLGLNAHATPKTKTISFAPQIILTILYFFIANICAILAVASH